MVPGTATNQSLRQAGNNRCFLQSPGATGPGAGVPLQGTAVVPETRLLAQSSHTRDSALKHAAVVFSALLPIAPTGGLPAGTHGAVSVQHEASFTGAAQAPLGHLSCLGYAHANQREHW